MSATARRSPQHKVAKKPRIFPVSSRSLVKGVSCCQHKRQMKCKCIRMHCAVCSKTSIGLLCSHLLCPFIQCLYTLCATLCSRRIWGYVIQLYIHSIPAACRNCCACLACVHTVARERVCDGYPEYELVSHDRSLLLQLADCRQRCHAGCHAGHLMMRNTGMNHSSRHKQAPDHCLLVLYPAALVFKMSATIKLLQRVSFSFVSSTQEKVADIPI